MSRPVVQITLFQRKALLFGFAAVAMNALVFATFALSRMSMWIVGHDAVNAQMDREGFYVEHEIAETFMAPRGVGIIFIGSLVFGIGFLIFLWHTLFRSDLQQDRNAEPRD